MSGENKKVGVLVAADANFVPAMADVVSPAVLAQVFQGEVIPFKLNSDGSVPMQDYLAWLMQQGQHALFDLNAHSEIVSPKKPVAVRNSRTKLVKVAA